MTNSSWCADTTTEVMPQVQANLPQGFAWDAVMVNGTVMNKFWRGVAGVIAWVNKRFCAYIDEFFCDTMGESRNQWWEEYGIRVGECDPYGSNLCYKVTDPGGQNCDHFTELALNRGLAITCENDSNTPRAGCARAGGTRLGPPPTLIASLQAKAGCVFGRAVDHPYPQYWEADADRSNNTCAVPGSNMGRAGCCTRFGYYEFPPDPVVDDGSLVSDPCNNAGTTKYMWSMPVSPPVDLSWLPRDSTGKFLLYGTHGWTVYVDLNTSQAAMAAMAANDAERWSRAGDMRAGCNQFDHQLAIATYCFLDDVMPAHTALAYAVQNTALSAPVFVATSTDGVAS